MRIERDREQLDARAERVGKRDRRLGDRTGLPRRTGADDADAAGALGDEQPAVGAKARSVGDSRPSTTMLVAQSEPAAQNQPGGPLLGAACAAPPA